MFHLAIILNAFGLIFLIKNCLIPVSLSGLTISVHGKSLLDTRTGHVLLIFLNLFFCLKIYVFS